MIASRAGGLPQAIGMVSLDDSSGTGLAGDRDSDRDLLRVLTRPDSRPIGTGPRDCTIWLGPDRGQIRIRLRTRQALTSPCLFAPSPHASVCSRMSLRVPFMSLVPGDDATAVREAIDRVIASGWFVLGPEVEAFESEFAAASGAKFGVGVGTGTDALALALRAIGVGAGDEVITSPCLLPTRPSRS